MSKRLKKRQQREQEELEQLKAAQAPAVAESAAAEPEEPEAEEQDEDEPTQATGPVNAFAALEDDGSEPEEEEEAEEEETIAAPAKKSKKKKPKKKKATKLAPEDVLEEADVEGSTPAGAASGRGKKKGDSDVQDGMDEIDRAIAELNLKNGASKGDAATSATEALGSQDSRQFMAWRNLLSVDPKNLDADAELRRFFGSKVIASTASTGGNRHRGGPSAKLRYTISKPKPNYPPATSLSGLGMRELSEEETAEMVQRRSIDGLGDDPGEKWFTFDHSPAWREITRQFMGAVRSHDPNELMALLQVYPWHVDTLLQMSEVYRLQSDIGAASDYAERALYAFDRCLMPAFNVSTGSCRLDFDRVENRPMFTALHRIISYLGRRGCWSTAFNFAKVLYSLDPLGDPHGAAFWLDFLAIKSGNGEWLISMLEQASHNQAAMAWHGYPGMAYAQALALRADENAKKHGDHTESDLALQEAIKKFPQVVLLLADKIGINVPPAARSNPLMQIQAGYSDDPSNVIHLLSHIYVSRSEPLWKESAMASWFERQVAAALPQIDSVEATEMRSDVLAIIHVPRDRLDEAINVNLFICRHVVCSESTSWVGFLPPTIRKYPVHAFDPLPPNSAISMYDNEYFAGGNPSASDRRQRAGAADAGVERYLERMLRAMVGEGGVAQVEALFREMMGRREFAHYNREQRVELLQHILAMGEEAAIDPAAFGVGNDGQTQDDGAMPGAFPGAGGA